MLDIVAGYTFNPKKCMYTVYSARSIDIYPNELKPCHTDLQIFMPPNTFGKILPIFNLLYKYGVSVEQCIIEENFSGSVVVMVHNYGKETFQIKKGDEIAQLMCQKCEYPGIQHYDPTE